MEAPANMLKKRGRFYLVLSAPQGVKGRWSST